MRPSKESPLVGRVKHVRLHWRVRSRMPTLWTIGPNPHPPQNTPYSVEWHEHRKSLNQRK
jgi:hypothetical protein